MKLWVKHVGTFELVRCKTRFDGSKNFTYNLCPLYLLTSLRRDFNDDGNGEKKLLVRLR